MGMANTSQIPHASPDFGHKGSLVSGFFLAASRFARAVASPFNPSLFRGVAATHDGCSLNAAPA